ncbi:hypothetical protein [Enterococcus casseliflavus]|nr:hypothetical protein [Enterococcus casseliflavus]
MGKETVIIVRKFKNIFVFLLVKKKQGLRAHFNSQARIKVI